MIFQSNLAGGKQFRLTSEPVSGKSADQRRSVTVIGKSKGRFDRLITVQALNE